MNEDAPPSPENEEKNPPDELYLISCMIKRAQTSGMLLEAIASFGDHRFDGDPVELAVSRALWDWDL